MLTFQEELNTGLVRLYDRCCSSGCPVCDPVPLHAARKAKDGWGALTLVTHVGTPDGILSSWLQPGPALILAIWGVNYGSLGNVILISLPLKPVCIHEMSQNQ